MKNIFHSVENLGQNIYFCIRSAYHHHFLHNMKHQQYLVSDMHISVYTHISYKEKGSILSLEKANWLSKD